MTTPKTSEMYGEQIARVPALSGRTILLAVEPRERSGSYRANVYFQNHNEDEVRIRFAFALSAPALERLIAALQTTLDAMRSRESPERFDAKETGE